MASKKPYKLKFDKKVDLFGNGKAKTWVLLANYSDKSMIRNHMAFLLGDELDLDTTSTRSVRDYRSAWVLTTQIMA